MERLDRSGIWFVLILLTAASFPWHERINTVGIILLTLHWLWDRNIIYKIKHIRPNTDLILFWLFFFIHIVWLAGSSYKSEGLQAIEVKLGFFLLPLLFSSENYLTEKRRKALEWTFILSTALSFLYCIVYTMFMHPNDIVASLTNRMIISKAIMHPGYYSNYLAFSIILLCMDLIEIKNKESNLLIVKLFLIGFLSVGILLFISKTAILILLCFAFYLGWKVSKFVKNLAFRGFSYLLFIFIFIAALWNYPPMQGRIKETFQNAKPLTPSEVKIWNTTGARYAAWSLSWEKIKENPIIGYGTGSSNYVLKDYFQLKGYSDLYNNQMHTHNQLFHTWLDTGIFGILILLAWLFWLTFRFLVQLKDIKAFWLMILILFNLLTDDMLEIQAGTVFFVFFAALYLFKDSGYKRPLLYTY